MTKVGTKLTMDMSVYIVERRDTKVDIKLAFALGHCYNVNPAVVKTVVAKLSSCVKAELTGLNWGHENPQDMMKFLLAKV